MDELNITSKLNGRNAKNGANPVKKQKNIPKESFNDVLDRITLKSAAPKKGFDKSKRSSEVRHDLVNKYRLDIKKGDYDVKSLNIADKIVQKIRDEKYKFHL